MSGVDRDQDRARVRARVGAGTLVWTLRERAPLRDPDWFEQDGPRSDHLAQLIRRQRRRQALRRLLGLGRRPLARRARPEVGPTPSAPPSAADAQWGWLSDGDVRRILLERDPARSVQPKVLDLRRAGRGASEALAALPRQADRRHERERADQSAVPPPGR